jgi:hypothetical protein
VMLPRHHDFERLVVVVAARFANGHSVLLPVAGRGPQTVAGCVPSCHETDGYGAKALCVLEHLLDSGAWGRAHAWSCLLPSAAPRPAGRLGRFQDLRAHRMFSVMLLFWRASRMNQ